MKNPSFTYHRPESLDEALALLAEIGDDAKVLAGGQSLLPIMALRLGPPGHLIDIGGVAGLGDIDENVDGSTSIGAMVRHARAERSSVVAARLPLVHEALPLIGHRAIRTRGTVVGSVAHADPAAEMPAVAVASGASIVATSRRGTRHIPASTFFEGYLQTSLESDELVTEVRFPEWPSKGGTAVVEVSRRHGDYALVGVATKLVIDGGTVTEAALAFFGVGSVPTRVTRAEDLLIGTDASPDALDAAAATVRAELEPASDIHGTADYRRHLAGVLTRRSLSVAHRRIGVAS